MPTLPMTPYQVRAFLDAIPPRPAVLATVRADGRPHAVPVWFARDGEDVVWLTGADTVKGRNLRRTGQAALCLDDDRPPFCYLSIEGPVAVEDDPAAVLRWATVLGGRYMGSAQASRYGRRNAVPGELLFRLRPERVISAVDVAR